ncbi:hypothetical protein MchiMG62_22200 [Methanoculleus chikugoensis]|uniref:Uncharacterized protein n=1 Tax=Methanoculleus chikugoensis TaxID=118126 RepID=A0ABM7H8N1_9EURY|nr:hypothetical protein MchiMG62_22200 [Methanoculleus chikugoensis]
MRKTPAVPVQVSIVTSVVGVGVGSIVGDIVGVGSSAGSVVAVGVGVVVAGGVGIAVSFAVGVAVTVTVGVAVGLVVGQGVFVAVGVTGVPSEELLLLLPPDDDEDHAQPPELRVSTTFENIPKIAFTILGPGSPSASTVLFSAASVVLSIVRETIASFTITEFISAESFNLPVSNPPVA